MDKIYDIVQKQFALSDDVLKAVVINSVDVAFLSAETKEILKKQINNDFSGWLHP